MKLSHSQFEAVKEVARLALLGAIGAIISWLSGLDPTATVTVALVVLRGIDKWIHESEETELNGLVPF